MGDATDQGEGFKGQLGHYTTIKPGWKENGEWEPKGRGTEDGAVGGSKGDEKEGGQSTQ